VPVDPPRRVVRNSRVHPRTADLPRPASASTPAAGVLVDVVVLSDDVALYQATRDAVGERNPVWRARTAAESVDLLLTGRCGVLLLDMGAVSTQPASLVGQIVDQFPDVVVVVAGRRDDETLLAQLVSDGHVYRFMHKPLSPKRAGMFLHAAIRAHVERRDGRRTGLQRPKLDRLHARFDPRKWLFVAGGLALFVAALAAMLVARHDGGNARPSPRDADRPAAAPIAGPLADPVLSRARAAQAAGRYEAPPGRNALDLYAAVLLARPDNAEARAGLATTSALLIERANAVAASGNAAEARRLAERVLAVDAGHAAAGALLARLDAPRAPEPVKAAGTPAAATAARPALPAAPSRFAAPGATAPRAASVPAPAKATAPPTPAQIAPSPRTARVMPDPLTPRIVTPPPAPKPAAQSGRSRSYGAPIASGHAVAGLAAPETAPAVRTDLPEPVAGPAIVARDLEALATPEPAYPPQAFRDRVEGWVEVEFTVNERGTTGDIVVVAGAPQGVFDAAATEAVAAWRYLPRIANGQPVAQRSSATLRFSVED
jgi:TonB family protein